MRKLGGQIVSTDKTLMLNKSQLAAPFHVENATQDDDDTDDNGENQNDQQWRRWNAHKHAERSTCAIPIGSQIQNSWKFIHIFKHQKATQVVLPP